MKSLAGVWGGQPQGLGRSPIPLSKDSEANLCGGLHTTTKAHTSKGQDHHIPPLFLLPEVRCSHRPSALPTSLIKASTSSALLPQCVTNLIAALPSARLSILLKP